MYVCTIDGNAYHCVVVLADDAMMAGGSSSAGKSPPRSSARSTFVHVARLPASLNSNDSLSQSYIIYRTYNNKQIAISNTKKNSTNESSLAMNVGNWACVH